MNVVFGMFLFFLLTIPIGFGSTENKTKAFFYQMASGLVYPHGSKDIEDLTETDKLNSSLQSMAQHHGPIVSEMAFGLVYPYGSLNLIQPDQVVSEEVDRTLINSIVDISNDFESEENKFIIKRLNCLCHNSYEVDEKLFVDDLSDFESNEGFNCLCQVYSKRLFDDKRIENEEIKKFFKRIENEKFKKFQKSAKCFHSDEKKKKLRLLVQEIQDNYIDCDPELVYMQKHDTQIENDSKNVDKVEQNIYIDEKKQKTMVLHKNQITILTPRANFFYYFGYIIILLFTLIKFPPLNPIELTITLASFFIILWLTYKKK